MRIEGFENVLINQTGSLDILSKLDTGDTLRARVVDIAANELLLKLGDGTLVNAGLMTSVDAKRGDIIDFIVKNKVNNQLILEILKDKGQNVGEPNVEDEIKNSLMQLGIKPDKRNMEAAAGIRANGAQINAETIAKVVDAAVRFKNLTVDKAAYLVSNNITPEEKSIASLNRFAEGRINLSAELLDLASSLRQIEDKNVALTILEKLNFLDYASQKREENTDNNASGIDYEDGKIYPEQKDGYIEGNIAQKSDKDYTGFKSKLPDSDDISTENLDKIVKNVDIEEEEILQLKKNTVDSISNYRENTDKAEKKLIELLRAIQASEDNRVSDQSHSKGRDEVESIKKSFEKMFVKVDEEANGRDINVREFYKDIYKKLEIVSKVLEDSDIPGKQEILNKIDNIKSDINFLNELNRHSVYFQIPFKIFDKNTTGELYILKRNNGRKRIDPQNATVFLSLNTENLGQVDSLISVNKKNVSINLRLEKSEIYDFIKENYIELYEGLLKKGYKLVNIKYRLIDEKVNLLNVQEVLAKEVERTRSKGFDFRI
ncbi:MAG TPA: flagellar hook-length control protein FliK [Acetivibrio sp.]|uniref:flagellar hook-length control protein FliK n=1 Tax=Acetivibrio sp. TaxID=1872092 RepID=UPI002C5C4E61|nr:flagellar hook-length control protein FliK [Acetivibrio sp.]HOM02732.1 flagellar hook-length control protein FliK [Acetivibrio sp.]